MSGRIYFLGENGDLKPMDEKAYEAEELLQRLLADHPDLLAGEQMNPDDPRRWLLLGREAGIPDQAEGSNRWAVDHVFLDHDAVPTFVEVKRSSDTRIRREVVGQMLDYVANAVAFWTVETLQSLLERERTDGGQSQDGVLSDFIGADGDADDFWERAKTNLRAGRVRLVFVADVLPTELRRIVEFLNEQTDPMEVLAVEVRRYEGEGVTTLVPRVIGQTVEAGARKSGRLPKRQWDEVSFFAALEERGGSGAVELARRVFEWAGRQGLRMAYGEGAKSGSCYPMLDLDGVNHYTISMWTYLKIQIQLGNMASAGLFESEVKRVELVERLNAIDGVHIPVDAIDRWPSVGMDDLAAADSLGDFLEVFDWYLDEIKSSWQPG